jgi:hypothetical protein
VQRPRPFPSDQGRRGRRPAAGQVLADRLGTRSGTSRRFPRGPAARPTARSAHPKSLSPIPACYATSSDKDPPDSPIRRDGHVGQLTTPAPNRFCSSLFQHLKQPTNRRGHIFMWSD